MGDSYDIASLKWITVLKWLMGCIFFTALLLVYSVYSYWMSYSDTVRAYENRYTNFLLADELRQSSDDLTRMVRTYAATGDQQYEQIYWKILAIRDGKSPRPENYNRIYWDTITAKLIAPHEKGEAIAFDFMIAGAGFTPDEMELLKKAHKESDRLVKLETQAMNAMKGIFIDREGKYTISGTPDRELAISLLFGKEYHIAKSDIMQPIDEFMSDVDYRTEKAIKDGKAKDFKWAVLSAVSLILLIVFIAAAYYYLINIIRSMKKHNQLINSRRLNNMKD